ncbi:hypothetical protein [Rossellomorea aquimaris]|uniref:hypothetical protein n=1 Tax=Rossellomorea aquimaris TaxID=189382 RepID=UPI001259B245|nr:hypothetical protein [Rossellomorea aquimaris]TYS87501.1 hypothetical protein FZC88_16025 [Rossellomorea aquimaris]
MDKFNIPKLKMDIGGVKPLPKMDIGEDKPVLKMDGLSASYKGMAEAEKYMREMQRNKLLKEQEAEQREIEMHEMTKQIAENTSHLPDMVGLIRKGNEVNEEILELYKEMMNVTKAQTVEEAESVIKKVVSKAQDTNDAIETMSSLINYGKMLLKLSFPDSGLE